MKTLVTHNGSFHADDVFTCATLLLIYPDAKVVRTRDPEIIEKGDIVFDVGRKYDGERFFDHHQEGGAGKRERGTPYAAFGLIWKHFGEKICSPKELEIIDKKLVQVVDSLDNGVDLFDQKSELENYTVATAISSFNKTILESEKNNDDMFMEVVLIAQKILGREIINAQEEIASEEIIDRAYAESSDKRMIIIDQEISLSRAQKYDEILYAIHPYGEASRFVVKALKKKQGSFESKKPLPLEWAGKEGEELQKITGVSDAIFCHNGRFIASAKTKEGAMALAKIALES